MYAFPQELAGKLNMLQQKQLGKGEIFLLAKAIADSLPLAPIDTDNISLYTLTHRLLINEIIYSLSNFTYVNEDTVKTIYRLVDELSLWRYNIAHNPPSILFKGDTNTVVDDISCLLRYVDVTYLCAVQDIVEKANWVYAMFRDVAKEVKAQKK